VRVVVADDAALIREGLRQLLPAHGFEVAAAVPDVPQLLAAIARTRPRVALVDIRMPPTQTTEGLAAAADIRRRFPAVGVLVLSQHVDADYALDLVRTNPSHCGYLLKDRVTEVAVLADAIQRVGAGETVIDRDLARVLLHRPAAGSRLEALTAREREVLELMALGLTDRSIGERLWLTPRTVETHVRHILEKLDLSAQVGRNRRVLAVLEYLRADG
jgi:DNA-binding NarL/FixJ family response regulator